MRSVSCKISFERKGKIDEETFFQPDEIKTPRCKDKYLQYDKRKRASKKVSYFYRKANFVQVCVRVPFKGS